MESSRDSFFKVQGLGRMVRLPMLLTPPQTPKENIRGNTGRYRKRPLQDATGINRNTFQKHSEKSNMGKESEKLVVPNVVW